MVDRLEDIRVGDWVICKLRVVEVCADEKGEVVCPGADGRGRGVDVGETWVPLSHVHVLSSETGFRIGDWIRPKGINDLGGPRVMRVVSFVDEFGNTRLGGDYAVTRPQRGALEGYSGPQIVELRKMERMKLRDWPKDVSDPAAEKRDADLF